MDKQNNKNKYFRVDSEREARALGFASRQKYMKFENKNGRTYYSFIRTDELIIIYKTLKKLGKVS